jgi:fatty acid desaturase
MRIPFPDRSDGMAMMAILLIGGLAAWLDHRSLVGALIWLPFLLACPLMHFVTHRHGHGSIPARSRAKAVEIARTVTSVITRQRL